MVTEASPHRTNLPSSFSQSLDQLPSPLSCHLSPRAESDQLTTSPKETTINEGESRLVFIADPGKTLAAARYDIAGNSIRTAKYSLLTFLPRNLFEQFHRVAYVYFLAIAILNQLPQLAVFGRGASIFPLAVVLLVTAVKDAYEDFRRHRSDRIENHRLASVLTNGQFASIKWKEIQVGDVVKLTSDSTLPADIVLLSTSDLSGVAYVQTLNLDGESNLKTRYARQETLSRAGGIEGLIGTVISCEKPNRNIYGFHANLEIDGRCMSLGPSNIVLRGCELKNTEWAIGVVVYAGSETKAMLNSSSAPSKRSRLERHMNKETVYLSSFLIVLCSIVSLLSGIWLAMHDGDLELAQFFHKKDYSTGDDSNYNYFVLGVQIFFTFLMSVIIFQIMIPISLYISMELVRLGQAYFMASDKRLCDETTNYCFQCKALNINEDLGQIKYIFSDKTGTLTQNKMEFQYVSINGVDYRNPDKMDGSSNKVWMTKKPVGTDPKLLRGILSNMEQGKCIRDFFLALACCNTIVPSVLDDEKSNMKLVDYRGESPDEQALVSAAAAYGFVLIERTSGHIVIDVLGERQRYI
jgi:phospholipid-transporting ATPase